LLSMLFLALMLDTVRVKSNTSNSQNAIIIIIIIIIIY